MNESYLQTRDQLKIYFDQTALKAWELMTNDRPLSGVRARVRTGRKEMRNVLIGALPQDLTGKRILDAGCGTGLASFELANRGATVLGVDIASNLIALANKRIPPELSHRVQFKVGDMLSEKNGNFDYVIAMDSLIHYVADDISEALGKLAKITKYSVCFTVAPKTKLLMILLSLGKIFPRSNRSPNIAPIDSSSLNLALHQNENFRYKQLKLLKRVQKSFYVSEALELKL